MIAPRRALSILLPALLALFLGATAAAAESRPPLLVFAAASLTSALQELGPVYARESGRPVKFSFAASSALARQIESGAKADVFFAADTDWMDYLQARELIDASTRVKLLGNRLVLIAPANSALQLKIAPGFALAAALGRGGRLSTGDPDSVPVGKYARSALTSLGVWNQVADRLVRADNVRTALVFVERGEVPLGIVYATDAAIDPGVRVVDTFPATSHRPIVYPIALTATADADAARFIAFLRGPAARAVFERYGFASADGRALRTQSAF
jgi:molybdate transport system substrate-binding protein